MKTYRVNQNNRNEVLESIKSDTKEIASFAKECGYEITYPFWKDDCFRMEILPDGSNKYSPKICVNDPALFLRTGEITFSIQTTSYGELDIDEYKLFMKASEKAFRLASYFNSMSQSDLHEMFPNVEMEVQ